MPIPSISRRTFLKSSAAAATALGFPAITYSQSPNSDIRVAVVGFNGRGQSHIGDLLKINGVKITGLCDVDETVLA
ncbi:MAG: twin-arginine translocation signal domain-containing protein, partial [Chthoniobacteraceae bacterium]